MVAWAGAVANSGAVMTVVSMRQHVAGLVAAATGAALLCLSAPEAIAQFGSIFGDPPPRPPASVPRQQQPQQQQQRAPQQQSSPFPFPFGQPQQQAPRPQPQRLPPGPPPSARVAPDAVESEPLPPPGAAQPAALPPGVKPARAPAQPANTGPQPGDEIVSAPPVQKIPNQQAVFSGLDKITGRIINFDAALGETVQFGALQVVPRVCYTRPPTEAAATDAFIEVSEVTLQGEVRRIFAGWMFAASPGLNAVEHPIYDVWLTDCKQPLVKVAEDPGPGANVGADQQPPAVAPAQRPQQPAAAAPRPQQQAQQPQPQQPARPRPPQQPAPQFNRAFPAPIR
jgi:hypothetical protein